MSRKLILGILLFGALGASVPSIASAASNAAATQAYLNANFALLRSAAGLEHASEASYKSILTNVRRECPAVAAESPQTYDSEQLSNELVGDLLVSATKPVHQAIARYAHMVSSLSWSNGRLTNAVHKYAKELSAMATMPLPDLCGDVRAWVSSHYATLPAATVAFNAKYKAVNVPIGELPAQLVSYEQGGQRGLIRNIQALEQGQADFEARAVNSYGEIMNTLVLQP